MVREPQVKGHQNLDFYAKLERVQSVLERIQREREPALSSLPREIFDVVQYIHTHLFEPSLNVNTARAGCRLRNNNVSTRFRQVLGVGIREYIEILRLEAAVSLLREECVELYLVGMAVGYSHQETFCRAFHRRFRKTPSELRFDPQAGPS